MWKNIQKQYRNNKLEIIAPTWKDEFTLHGGCYSVLDIQKYRSAMKYYPLILQFMLTSTELTVD